MSDFEQVCVCVCVCVYRLGRERLFLWEAERSETRFCSLGPDPSEFVHRTGEDFLVREGCKFEGSG